MHDERIAAKRLQVNPNLIIIPLTSPGSSPDSTGREDWDIQSNCSDNSEARRFGTVQWLVSIHAPTDYILRN